MIVDAHAHLGFDEAFDEDFTEAALLESQQRNGIDITLVQPGTVHTLDAARRSHDAVAELCRHRPGRFYGIANPNPYLPAREYEAEVRRCVTELGFVGLKLNPFAHGVNPTGRCGRRVFDAAEESGVPVMVHTGSGIPWSAPALLEPIAAARSRLKMVLAHAGGMMLAAEAGLVAERCANVWLECSWIGGFVVRQWARKLGAPRLLFGSDHADNAAAELAKFRTSGCTEEELAWMLGGTAVSLFRLDGR